jgi:hypothetical protein
VTGDRGSELGRRYRRLRHYSRLQTRNNRVNRTAGALSKLLELVIQKSNLKQWLCQLQLSLLALESLGVG